MADVSDMALDDIIKANKKTPRGGGAGRKFNTNRRSAGGRGGNRGSEFRNGLTGGALRGRNRGGNRGNGFRNGRTEGVLRGRNRGGIAKSSSYTRGDVRGNSTWKHVMFNDFAARKIHRDGRGGGAITTGTTKLLISNLDFEVSDLDMQELFSEFGILKSAAVHYNRTGRSLGTAHVVFARRPDALKAMKQYNGVTLDGMVMNIQLVTSEINASRTDDSERLGGGSRSAWRNTYTSIDNRNSGGRGRDNLRRVGAGRGRDNLRRGGAGRGRRPFTNCRTTGC